MLSKKQIPKFGKPLPGLAQLTPQPPAMQAGVQGHHFGGYDIDRRGKIHPNFPLSGLSPHSRGTSVRSSPPLNRAVEAAAGAGGVGSAMPLARDPFAQRVFINQLDWVEAPAWSAPAATGESEIPRGGVPFPDLLSRKPRHIVEERRLARDQEQRAREARRKIKEDPNAQADLQSKLSMDSY